MADTYIENQLRLKLCFLGELFSEIMKTDYLMKLQLRTLTERSPVVDSLLPADIPMRTRNKEADRQTDYGWPKDE